MKYNGEMDKQRVMFFTDALLAIIMTILVLDIKVPDISATNNKEFAKQLKEVIPHFLGFIISFAFILVIWLSHHDLMLSLRKMNRNFTSLNFFFIGCVATLPFTTALAANYPGQPYAVALFATNMLLINISFGSLFVYANKFGLEEPGFFSYQYDRYKQVLSALGLFISLAAIFVSFISPMTALIMAAAIPISHCIPVVSK